MPSAASLASPAPVRPVASGRAGASRRSEGGDRQHRPDQGRAVAQRQTGPDPGAERLAAGHRRGQSPGDVPAGQEDQQGRQVACEVQELAMGGGPPQVVAEQGHIAQGEEGSGTGAEESVVKPHSQADRQSQRPGRSVAVGCPGPRPGARPGNRGRTRSAAPGSAPSGARRPDAGPPAPRQRRRRRCRASARRPRSGRAPARANRQVAVPLPNTAWALLVARVSTGPSPAHSSAGMEISPPPPAMESTSPAARPDKKSRERMSWESKTAKCPSDRG